MVSFFWGTPGGGVMASRSGAIAAAMMKRMAALRNGHSQLRKSGSA
jgi:formiminotetrahydrofolate cyclodeaminase